VFGKGLKGRRLKDPEGQETGRQALRFGILEPGMAHFLKEARGEANQPQKQDKEIKRLNTGRMKI
jgi:hypothetical protein